MASIRGLTPEARAVQLEAARLVREDLGALVREYRRRFGIIVGTDFARELFAKYSVSIESRLNLAAAVRRSAARIGTAAFAQILSERGRGMVLFTAGGTGAGRRRRSNLPRGWRAPWNMHVLSMIATSIVLYRTGEG